MKLTEREVILLEELRDLYRKKALENLEKRVSEVYNERADLFQRLLGGLKSQNTRKNHITQAELRSCVVYSPDTGLFKEIDKIDGVNFAGRTLGKIYKNGYVYIVLKGGVYLAHRLAFMYMVGYFPENMVDHINRDRADNRWSNLREVNHSCNVRNSPLSSKNTTGVKGVSFMPRCRNKWCASIGTGKTGKIIGYFENLDLAAMARWEAEKEHGYPNCYSESSAFKYLVERGIL